jgi:chromosome segregation ATPase
LVSKGEVHSTPSKQRFWIPNGEENGKRKSPRLLEKRRRLSSHSDPGDKLFDSVEVCMKHDHVKMVTPNAKILNRNANSDTIESEKTSKKECESKNPLYPDVMADLDLKENRVTPAVLPPNLFDDSSAETFQDVDLSDSTNERAINNTIEELERTVQLYQSEISVMEKIVKEKDIGMKSIQANLENLSNALDDMKKAEALKVQAEYEAKLRMYDSELKEKETLFSKLNVKVSYLDEELKMRQIAITDMQAKSILANKELNRKDSKIAELFDQIHNLENNLNSSECELNKKEANLVHLKSIDEQKLHEVECFLKAKERELHEKESEVELISAQIKTLDSKLSSTESDSLLKQDKIHKLEINNVKLDSKISELEHIIEEKDFFIQNLNQLIQEKNLEFKEILEVKQSEIITHENLIQDLEKTVEQKDKQLDTQATNIIQLTRSITQKEVTIEDLLVKNADCEALIEKFKEEIEVLIKKNEELNVLLQSKMSELDAFKLNSQIHSDALRQELDQMTQEKDCSIEELQCKLNHCHSEYHNDISVLKFRIAEDERLLADKDKHVSELLNEMQESKKAFMDMLKKSESVNYKNEAKIRNITNENIDLTEKVSELRENQQKLEEANQAQKEKTIIQNAQFASYNSKINDLEAIHNSEKQHFQSQLFQREKQIESLETKLSQLVSEHQSKTQQLENEIKSLTFKIQEQEKMLELLYDAKNQLVSVAKIFEGKMKSIDSVTANK